MPTIPKEEKIMVRKVIVTNGNLQDSEKSLSLEQRNEIFLNELENFGFLRNCRLADVNTLPKHDFIEVKYEHNDFCFSHLPSDVDKLHLLVVGNDILNIYTNDDVFALPDRIYSGREIVTIEHPKTGTLYHLDELCSASTDIMTGEGTLCFVNTLTMPHRFIYQKYSTIDIFICRDGYLRINLNNCEFTGNPIIIRKSAFFENSFDIVLGVEEPADGDILIQDVKDGMVIYNPILASALTQQAAIEALDVVNSVFVGKVTYFYDPDNYEPLYFVDYTKSEGISACSYNKDIFCIDM
jgi:hypothetical protein